MFATRLSLALLCYTAFVTIGASTSGPGAATATATTVSSKCVGAPLPWSKTLSPHALGGESLATYYRISGDLILSVTGHYRHVSEPESRGSTSNIRSVSSAAPMITIALPVSAEDLSGHKVKLTRTPRN